MIAKSFSGVPGTRERHSVRCGFRQLFPSADGEVNESLHPFQSDPFGLWRLSLKNRPAPLLVFIVFSDFENIPPLL